MMEQVKLIVADVDGTLTDGLLDIDEDGMESHRFHIHDGLGIVMAQTIGLQVAVLSARSSKAVEVRMRHLGVATILQGVRDKAQALRQLMENRGLNTEQVAFIGDDLTDMPAFEVVGVKIAVADAAEYVRAAADWITSRGGGRGGVRDAIDEVLRRQGRLDEAIAAFLARPTSRIVGQ